MIAEINFTSHLRNLVTGGPLSATGATVGEAVENSPRSRGVLWTSDDGGRSWQLVNAHLPPIYAVRFV